MRFALLLLVAGCLIGVAVLVATVATTPPEPPASVAGPASDAGTTARIAALEADVARLTRTVEGLRFELEAASPQRSDPASPASASAALAPAPEPGAPERDPLWYLREYERSFEGRPEGSTHFRMAVEAWVVELVAPVCGRLADARANAAFRTALAQILGDARLARNARVVDALFACLTDPRPPALGAAALESLSRVGDAATAQAIERIFWNLPIELRERALRLVMTHAGDEANRALLRLWALAPDQPARGLLLAHLNGKHVASAIELLRTASTDADGVRIVAAQRLVSFRGEAYLAFVDEWLGYERNEAVIRILNGARARMTGKQGYSPDQAAGAPDAIPDQDHPNAWACQNPDSGRQWLELRYAPRRAAKLRIHEVCVAGAIAEIVLIDESGGEHKVWSGVDPTTKPGVFEVSIATTSYRVAAVRLVLDTDRASGWSEIDAVELSGPDGNAWAISATASSWFGGG